MSIPAIPSFPVAVLPAPAVAAVVALLPAAPQPLDESLGEVTGPMEALTGPPDEPA